MNVLLKNGRVIDPANRVDRVMDLRVAGDVVAEVRPSLPAREDEVFDCAGMVVAPGFIDAHVHFRQPGFEHKETIATGSAAAAAGGYTTVVCEPNTKPPRDSRERVAEVLAIGERDGVVRVLTKACLTRGSEGREVSPLLAGPDAAGAAAASDDGNPVLSRRVMLEACRAAARHGLVVTPHSEDSHQSNARLPEVDDAPPGLRGEFADEAALVERDIACAREAGCRLHIAHVSLAASLDLIRKAKAQGLPVTCEATPHHLTLAADAQRELGPNACMCPPLRSADDVRALREAVADGTVDCLATDHAPHSAQDKADGAMGVIGLETAFGVLHTKMVAEGEIALPELVALMTSKPAAVLGLPYGRLSVGACADIVVIDPRRAWTVDVEAFASRSRNCPFAGWALVGRPVLTLSRGKVVSGRRGAGPA